MVARQPDPVHGNIERVGEQRGGDVEVPHRVAVRLGVVANQPDASDSQEQDDGAEDKPWPK